ncbi:hypothetical protein CAPTEDRAFT_215846 [Capitella teleta]|uniref:Uncharacterized protein n=1 Tax=Capitella teleta TaxID=283909 RepID=R7VEA7_CAPTE|nr:hypothetical protein CAPTEDRAFT_215846 [Capitella teleta]|eukprot:ELU14010.1 hypothetical protein CAPTEDRAFT_215846 [Capitella teleta]
MQRPSHHRRNSLSDAFPSRTWNQDVLEAKKQKSELPQEFYAESFKQKLPRSCFDISRAAAVINRLSPEIAFNLKEGMSTIANDVNPHPAMSSSPRVINLSSKIVPRRNRRSKSCDRGMLNKTPQSQLNSHKPVSIYDKQTVGSPAQTSRPNMSTSPEDLPSILKSPGESSKEGTPRLLTRRVTFEENPMRKSRTQMKGYSSCQSYSNRRHSLPLVKCSFSGTPRDGHVTEPKDAGKVSRDSEDIVCDVVHAFMPRYYRSQPKAFNRTLYHYLS